MYHGAAEIIQFDCHAWAPDTSTHHSDQNSAQPRCLGRCRELERGNLKCARICLFSFFLCTSSLTWPHFQMGVQSYWYDYADIASFPLPCTRPFFDFSAPWRLESLSLSVGGLCNLTEPAQTIQCASGAGDQKSTLWVTWVSCASSRLFLPLFQRLSPCGELV